MHECNDAMYISGEDDQVNYGNLEIAYNYFLHENSWNIAYPDPPHSDIIQLYRIDMRGGSTKIHHNFFGSNADSVSKWCCWDKCT